MLKGSKVTDDRGSLTFNNEFKLTDVKRTYIVENHGANFIRAWHGHKKEKKYIMCLSGAAIVCYTPLIEGESVTVDPPFLINRKILSPNGDVLEIPAGMYNGWKSLTDDTKLMVFSCSTLEESLNDDIRKEVEYFDTSCWQVVQR